MANKYLVLVFGLFFMLATTFAAPQVLLGPLVDPLGVLGYNQQPISNSDASAHSRATSLTGGIHFGPIGITGTISSAEANANAQAQGNGYGLGDSAANAGAHASSGGNGFADANAEAQANSGIGGSNGFSDASASAEADSFNGFSNANANANAQAIGGRRPGRFNRRPFHNRYPGIYRPRHHNPTYPYNNDYYNPELYNPEPFYPPYQQDYYDDY